MRLPKRLCPDRLSRYPERCSQVNRIASEAHNEYAEVAVRGHPEAATRKEGTTMPNAVVMTGYGPPEMLKWASVPLREPGEGQIRIKVKAAGISPTDLALRVGYLKEVFPMPPNAVLGFEAAGTVDAVGPGVTGERKQA